MTEGPEKLSIEEIAKLQASPLFADLADELKDPLYYAGIEKCIADVMYSDHKHKTMKGFSNCKRCEKKFYRQQELKREIGFSSQNQYLQWRRIMSIIIAQQDIHIS